MSQQMRESPRVAGAGTKRSIKSSSLEGATLNAGNEVTVFSTQVPADKIYAHGFGSGSRNQGRTAYVYAALVAAGSGTGSAGDAIEGDLVLAITDSEQRDVLARYEFSDLESLADAEADARTDRPLEPVLEPLASEDRHLELRVIADDASDGVVVDPSASSARFYYTDINA
jgi:hypothetical protein